MGPPAAPLSHRGDRDSSPTGCLKKWNLGWSVRNRTLILQGKNPCLSVIRVDWTEETIEGGSNGSGLFDTMGRPRGVVSRTPVNQTACGLSRRILYGHFAFILSAGGPLAGPGFGALGLRGHACGSPLPIGHGGGRRFGSARGRGLLSHQGRRGRPPDVRNDQPHR